MKVEFLSKQSFVRTLGEAWTQLKKSLHDEAEVHLKFSNKVLFKDEHAYINYGNEFKPYVYWHVWLYFCDSCGQSHFVFGFCISVQVHRFIYFVRMYKILVVSVMYPITHQN